MEEMKDEEPSLRRLLRERVQQRRRDGIEVDAPQEHYKEHYSSGGLPTPTEDRSALLPRMRDMEVEAKAMAHKISVVEETQIAMDSRLAEAIAKLAAKVGVPLQDLGL